MGSTEIIQNSLDPDVTALIVGGGERPMVTGTRGGLLQVDQLSTRAKPADPLAVVEVWPAEAIVHARLVADIQRQADRTAVRSIRIPQEALRLREGPRHLAGD